MQSKGNSTNKIITESKWTEQRVQILKVKTIKVWEWQCINQGKGADTQDIMDGGRWCRGLFKVCSILPRQSYAKFH